MWIFTFLPEFFIHLLFVAGLLGIIASLILEFVPFVKIYKTVIQVVSIIVLSLSLYLEGGLAEHKEWEYKANELKAKIAKMEADMSKSDIKIIEKVVTKTQTIREKGKQVIIYVDSNMGKYDERFSKNGQCVLPTEFFKAYNDSLNKETK